MGASDASRDALSLSQLVFDSRMVRAFLPAIAGSGALGSAI